MRFFLLVLLTLHVCVRTQAQTPAPTFETRHETVVVTGTYEPIPLEEADRALRVFDLTADRKILASTVFDFFRLEPSLDLRGRAPGGVQSDLSIRGGSFGQTLVLLDGLRLNDAQSGHHNLDIPVPLDALGRVEVLKGAGSAFYGSDAVGGVVNLITRPPESSELRLRTAAGSFGVNQQSGSLALVHGQAAEQLSFSRDFSTGFMDDRDYRNLSLASTTHLKSSLGPTDVVLAHNARPFGANQFYGNFNSWERTGSWFASLRQGLGANTQVSFAYRRHTDLFVLYRDRPAVFTNRHATESWQAALRRHGQLGHTFTLSYGAEAYHDSIDSGNLGQHARSRGAGYVAVDARALRRFSLTLAGRQEAGSGGARQFSPTASAGAWLSPHWKLRGGISGAFRLPSYTDLYYHDPGNAGSPGLRPERAWSYEVGLDWNASERLRGEATVFHRRERDGIDYLRRSPADIWRAANIQRLDFTGVEAALVTTPWRSQRLEFSYTALHGAQDALAGLYSKYAFNYPVHSGVVSWQAAVRGVLVRTRIGVLERFQRGPYAVWDAYVALRHGRWTPFAQFTNLAGTKYQEIPGVDMPGRAALVGLEWRTKL